MHIAMPSAWIASCFSSLMISVEQFGNRGSRTAGPAVGCKVIGNIVSSCFD